MRKKIGIFSGALAGLAVLSFVAFVMLTRNVIPYGTTISGIAVGGLAKAEAASLVSPAYLAYENTALTLEKDERTVTATPRELGIAFSVSETIESAYALGKGKTLLGTLGRTALFLARQKNLTLKASLDDAAFDAYFKKRLASWDQTAKNASLVWSPSAAIFQGVEEETGVIINQSKLKYDLLKETGMLSRGTIQLAMQEDRPTVTTAMLRDAQTQANDLLADAPFTLVYRDSRNATSSSTVLTQREQLYLLEKNQLKDMLVFEREGATMRVRPDDEAIKNMLIEIAPAINEKPKNAVLTFEKGAVKEFVLSQSGVTLMIDETAERVKNALFAPSKTDQKRIELAITLTLPEIRTETIEHLGFTALLSKGESNFAGSSAARAFNVKLGAKKLNAAIIKPGEEFSFLATIGEINQEEGYQAGLVIKGAQLVPEYGGGVCQVSTTLFRAAILAGLKITERFPHSLPVQYYNPQGFDATVYGPHPDLRFINDTSSSILVQTKVVGTKLYFELYGTPDGREVKMTGPVEYDKKPDGSLKAKFTREIYRNGELAKTEVFTSSYRSPSQAAIVKNPLE